MRCEYGGAVCHHLLSNDWGSVTLGSYVSSSFPVGAWAPVPVADLGGPITTDGRKLSAPPTEVELSHIYLFKISADLS